MYKDKRVLVAHLRSYKKHILGPLFFEAADAIEELLQERDALTAQIETMTHEAESNADSCQIAAEKAHGHWIYITVEDDPLDKIGVFRHRYMCSVCGVWQSYGTTDFCHNCGAAMR